MTPGQIRTWPIREKEAYAIVSILKKYASLFNLQPILILTDHRSLENWTTEVLEQPGGPTGRRARCHSLLSKFKIEVRYVKGQENQLADCMSRWAYPAGCGEDQFFHGTPQDEELAEKYIQQEMDEEAKLCSIFGGKPRQFISLHCASPTGEAHPEEIPVMPVHHQDQNVFEKNWPSAYGTCPFFAKFWEKINGSDQDWPSGFQRHGDFLFFETKLCVPSSFLGEIIHSHHRLGGHLSFAKLWSEMLRRYALPHISEAGEICRDITQKCETCQANEHLHTKNSGPMKPTPIPPVPMDNIAIDVFYMNHTKCDGNEYDCLILIVDLHSRWVTAFPDTRSG